MLCSARVPIRDADGRQTGEWRPCKAKAVAGAEVCRMHGARAPQVREAARRRVEAVKVHEEARKVLVRGARVTDPLATLQEQATEANAVRRLLAARVLASPDQAAALIQEWGHVSALLLRALQAWMAVMPPPPPRAADAAAIEASDERAELLRSFDAMAAKWGPAEAARQVRGFGDTMREVERILAESDAYMESAADVPPLNPPRLPLFAGPAVSTPPSEPTLPALPPFEGEATPDPQEAVSSQDGHHSPSAPSALAYARELAHPERTGCRHQQVSKFPTGDIVTCGHCSQEWAFSEAKRLGIWQDDAGFDERLDGLRRLGTRLG